MPFAPFVGVNHHGQSILFGCGLISNKDTQTFVWLFKAWLDCMEGCAPSGIITDQDRAMQNAIQLVFPNTRHRWCLWHIMKKLPEKMGGHVDKDHIMFKIHELVYDSQHTTEFEAGWEVMLQRFSQEHDEWLLVMYNERRRWVPCYLKPYFWADMSTNQRSESMNAFFDGINGSTFEVRENHVINGFDKSSNLIVEYDNSTSKGLCSCHLFEFRGIPCRHFLMVLIRHDVKVLPDCYIMSRWRRDIKRAYTRVKINYDGWITIVEQQRFDKLCKTFETLANSIADDEEKCNSVMMWLQRQLEQHDHHPSHSSICGVMTPLPQSGRNVAKDQPQIIHNPKSSKRKGAPRKNRLKGPLEKGKTNAKVCCLALSVKQQTMFK
ncbi:unnamed protein product, partial [Cuscuta europaea]